MKHVSIILCALAITMTIMPTDTRQLHQYVWANYLQFAGKSTQAEQWYQKMFEDKTPSYAYEGYLHFLFETKQYQRIVALIPKLDTFFADDPYIQRIFATALENIGRKQEAIDRFTALSKKFKTDQEIIFHTAQIFIGQGNFQKGLEVIQSYVDNAPRKPNNFIFYFLKSQIHLQLNQMKQAQESIKQSLELYPHFDKSWLLYAVIEEQAGNITNAINGYTSFLEQSQEAANAQIEQHLLELVFKQQVINNQSKSINIKGACFNETILLFQKKQYRKALKHLERCIKQEGTDNEKKLMKVQILSSMHKYHQAARLLQTWLEQEPENDLWFHTLHLLHRQGLAYKSIISTIQKIEKKNPTALLPLLYQADLYVRTNNVAMADSYLKKALTRTSDPALQTKILFQRGLLYYDTKQFDKMKDVLEQAQSLHIPFAPLFNLLAHYYAQIEKQYDHAQRLITQALSYDAENPHFLGTQAAIVSARNQQQEAWPVLPKNISTNYHKCGILKHLNQTLHHKQAKHIMKKVEKTKRVGFARHGLQGLKKILWESRD